MPLSDREQRILAGIEDRLYRKDPELADLFRRQLPASPRRYLLSGARLGRLVVMLVALVFVYPLAASWGAAGVGLVTAALIVPWMVLTARASARLQRHPDPVDRAVTTAPQGQGLPKTGWAALAIVLMLWTLIVAVLVASGVGLADAALVAVALAMLVGVHVVQRFARLALARRFGPGGGQAGTESPDRED